MASDPGNAAVVSRASRRVRFSDLDDGSIGRLSLDALKRAAAMVRAKVGVVELASQCGYDYSGPGNHACPGCEHESASRKTLRVYENGKWWCFHCAKGGDAIDWYAARERCDWSRAVRLLAYRYGVTAAALTASPAALLDALREPRREACEPAGGEADAERVSRVCTQWFERMRSECPEFLRGHAARFDGAMLDKTYCGPLVVRGVAFAETRGLRIVADALMRAESAAAYEKWNHDRLAACLADLWAWVREGGLGLKPGLSAAMSLELHGPASLARASACALVAEAVDSVLALISRKGFLPATVAEHIASRLSSGAAEASGIYYWPRSDDAIRCNAPLSQRRMPYGRFAREVFLAMRSSRPGEWSPMLAALHATAHSRAGTSTQAEIDDFVDRAKTLWPLRIEEIFAAAGMLSRDATRDALAGRMVVPILSPTERVLSFAGRVRPGANDPDAPKWINLRNSPCFSKGGTLFNLGAATAARIAVTGQAVICEGYFDALAMGHASAHHGAYTQTLPFGAVATMGAALTSRQAEVLRRLGCTVSVVMMDGDEAGRAASERACDVLRGARIEPRVMRLPEGRDPDEMVYGERERSRTIAAVRELFLRQRRRGLGAIRAALARPPAL